MFVCAVVAASMTGLAQRPAVGDAAPWRAVADLQGMSRTLEDCLGPRGLVIVFWAAWSERSLDELAHLDTQRERLVKQGVGLVAINVERQVMDAASVAELRQWVAARGIGIPIIVDDGLEMFHAYGVATVPTTVLLDGHGKVALIAAGYFSGQREQLADKIDALAGVERPTPTSSDPIASPTALRRHRMGRLQLAGGRSEQARASFEAAAKADPAFVDPLVELAALALDDGDLASARRWLDKAAALVAEDGAVVRERVRLGFLAGDLSGEAAALQLRMLSARDRIAAAYAALLIDGRARAEVGTEMARARRAEARAERK